MLFNKRTVYLGYSQETFNKIRNAFDKNNLRYDYRIHSASFEAAGRGTMPQTNDGGKENPEFENRYEIFVKKADREKANYYIHLALT